MPLKDREARNAYMREYRKTERYRKSRVLRIHKHLDFTQGDWQEMFKAQKGCCAICGKPQKLTKKTKDGRVFGRLNVDHCHKTNVVRGLLCWSCNHKLGWFEKYHKQVRRYLKGGQL